MWVRNFSMSIFSKTAAQATTKHAPLIATCQDLPVCRLLWQCRVFSLGGVELDHCHPQEVLSQPLGRTPNGKWWMDLRCPRLGALTLHGFRTEHHDDAYNSGIMSRDQQQTALRGCACMFCNLACSATCADMRFLVFVEKILYLVMHETCLWHKNCTSCVCVANLVCFKPTNGTDRRL